jgi:hypothetical protein
MRPVPSHLWWNEYICKAASKTTEQLYSSTEANVHNAVPWFVGGALNAPVYWGVSRTMSGVYAQAGSIACPHPVLSDLMSRAGRDAA